MRSTGRHFERARVAPSLSSTACFAYVCHVIFMKARARFPEEEHCLHVTLLVHVCVHDRGPGHAFPRFLCESVIVFHTMRESNATHFRLARFFGRWDVFVVIITRFHGRVVGRRGGVPFRGWAASADGFILLLSILFYYYSISRCLRFVSYMRRSTYLSI